MERITSHLFTSEVQSELSEMIGWRRHLHQHPELSFEEHGTTEYILDILKQIPGLEIRRPAATGCIAVLKGAAPQEEGMTAPARTILLRADIDALPIQEENSLSYRSVCSQVMHACGHDGHTSVGLAVAEVLAGMKDQLAGTIKLIFQPAEEGVRGAKAMMVKGVVDDVKYIVGMHLGVNLRKTGQVACMTEGFLATTKLDATFTGVPAHAGAAPETGKNAILAACTATLNLHAISRHSQGASRVNVGVIQGGSGRNVIPANAVIKVETRGAVSDINEYVYAEAVRIIEAAAVMQGCTVSMELMGGAAGCGNDPELVARIRKVAERQKLLPEILPAGNIGGSEDCTYFMERVQQKGGQAAFVMVGTELAAGHHDSFFDFNEEALVPAIALMSGAAADLLTQG